MRLLDKTSLELKWFNDEDLPPYLILSHRWRGAESTLQDFEREKQADIDKQSAGTDKVLRFCREAQSYSVQYVWIDTVCIDKSSSAELQEAINSMYKWYEQAALCIVYLDDVTVGEESIGSRALEDELAGSTWFTRGWCLQELLASTKQVFLNCEWSSIGTREALGDSLERITGIRKVLYGNSIAIRAAPAAERMSWMSSRQTSRVEDLAYCMLGIFDVNMTMLYGEGSKAFLRLQREIIGNVDDESIFIWQPVTDYQRQNPTILAPHPKCFSVCRGLVIEKDMYYAREPYRFTIKGLEIELCNQRMYQFMDELLVPLNCAIESQCVGIVIERNFDVPAHTNQWVRKFTEKIETCSKQDLYIPQDAFTEYERRKQEIIHSQSLYSRGTPQFRGAASTMSDFKLEEVRFKVYIQ